MTDPGRSAGSGTHLCNEDDRTYQTRLLDRTEAAQGIWTYRLTRPEGFTFRPGQWCFLNLPDIGLQDVSKLARREG